MADQPSIRRITEVWLSQMGGKVPIEARVEAFRSLLNTLKAHGYTDEDFSDSQASQVVSRCVPSKAAYRGPQEKRQRWLATTAKDLDIARAEIFGSDIKIEPPGERPKIVVPEPSQQEEFQRVGKELDRSLLTGLPEPKLEIDEDFMKSLDTGTKDG